MPKWEDLPPELLIKIAASSDGTTWMWGACRAWKSGLESVTTGLNIIDTPLPLNLANRFTSLSTLDLQDCPLVTPQALENLQGLPLTSLSLKLKLEDISLDIVAALRGLSIPDLSLELGSEADEANISDKYLKMLEGVPLSRLHLFGAQTSEAGLAPLRDMPLTDVLLWGKALGEPTGDVLGLLRGKPLTALDLANCDDIYFGDADLEALRGMPLTELFLGKCDRVTDSGLEVLRGMPLTGLDVSSAEAWKLTDAGLEVLRGMKLTDLELAGQENITDAGLEFIRGMPLTRLGLGWTKVSDAGLQILKGMAIADLDLGGTDVTDAGLAALEGMPLTTLDLESCGRLHGTGLTSLQQSPLTALNVVGCEMLDAWMLAKFWKARAGYWKDWAEKEVERRLAEVDGEGK